MMLLMVNVLPVPVAPLSTCCFNPFSKLLDKVSIASIWSPMGLYGATSLNLDIVITSFYGLLYIIVRKKARHSCLI